jgi:hypothetical protein
VRVDGGDDHKSNVRSHYQPRESREKQVMRPLTGSRR